MGTEEGVTETGQTVTAEVTRLICWGWITVIVLETVEVTISVSVEASVVVSNFNAGGAVEEEVCVMVVVLRWS